MNAHGTGKGAPYDRHIAVVAERPSCLKDIRNGLDCHLHDCYPAFSFSLTMLFCEPPAALLLKIRRRSDRHELVAKPLAGLCTRRVLWRLANPLATRSFAFPFSFLKLPGEFRKA